MEKKYTRSINSQTALISRLDGDIAGLSTQAAAFDEGVQSLAKRVDEGLLALDGRVDRCRVECDCMEDELVLAQGRISVLEDRVRSHTGDKGSNTHWAHAEHIVVTDNK